LENTMMIYLADASFALFWMTLYVLAALGHFV
jgi:hypothetical protein